MDAQARGGGCADSRSGFARGASKPGNGARSGPPRSLKARPLEMRDAGIPGRPLPYAFLIQQPRRQDVERSGSRLAGVATPQASLSLRIRAIDDDGLGIDSGISESEWDPSWTWEGVTPDAAVGEGCDLPWYVQAACEAGFTDFRLRDADGLYRVLAMTESRLAFCGEFTMRSFRVATIRSFAVSWASDPRNADVNGRLQFPSEVHIVGGQGAVSPLDRLQLTAVCGDDTVITDPYFARLRLRISLAG